MDIGHASSSFSERRPTSQHLLVLGAGCWLCRDVSLSAPEAEHLPFLPSCFVSCFLFLFIQLFDNCSLDSPQINTAHQHRWLSVCFSNFSTNPCIQPQQHGSNQINLPAFSCLLRILKQLQLSACGYPVLPGDAESDDIDLWCSCGPEALGVVPAERAAPLQGRPFLALETMTLLLNHFSAGRGCCCWAHFNVHAADECCFPHLVKALYWPWHTALLEPASLSACVTSSVTIVFFWPPEVLDWNQAVIFTCHGPGQVLRIRPRSALFCDLLMASAPCVCFSPSPLYFRDSSGFLLLVAKAKILSWSRLVKMP